jgi:mycothiol synthase
MNKYSVRSARLSDLNAVHEIVANQTLHDFGSPRSVADIKQAWQTMDLDEDTCAAFANGKMAGYAELLDNDSPFIYLAELNNVDLAFHLLTILEEKAILRNKGSVNLFSRISAKNKTLADLFAAKGYKSNLSFLIMELALEEMPVEAHWPEGISVRPFTRNQDELATYNTDEEASKDKGYHDPLSYEDWVLRMGMDKASFDPSLWFLACKENEVVGVALNVLAEATPTGWVDHLSVRRPWRKQGIGKALLLHTFGEFYRRGIKQIKLSVDSRSLTGAPHLYESVGMKTIQEYFIYRKQL